MMFTSQLFVFIQSRTLGMVRSAPAEEQVSQRRKRRYEDGGHDERYSAKKGSVLLREVYPDGHQDVEVGREHREQQQSGQKRRPWPGILHGAKPPGGFARLAAHVALDGQEYEQSDQQVLDDVAERSGI